MKDYGTRIQEISPKVEDLYKLAEEIYQESEDFPAINRNVKRILASAYMLKLNLEKTTE